jgi:hypothetical protein
MSFTKKIATHLIPALTGSIAALVVVGATSSAPKGVPESREAVPAATPRGSQATFEPDERSENRLRMLEHRLADVARAVEARPEDDSLPPEVEEERVRLREHAMMEWRQALEEHEAQDVDANWSHEVGLRFADDIEAFASDGAFLVSKIDCRSTSCTAQLEFTSFDDATRHFATLLTARYRENCGTKTLFEEPQDPAAPYAVTMLYDCSEAKAARRGLLDGFAWDLASR